MIRARTATAFSGSGPDIKAIYWPLDQNDVDLQGYLSYDDHWRHLLISIKQLDEVVNRGPRSGPGNSRSVSSS